VLTIGTELKKNGGSIINITATLHYGATPWQVHASAAKAGVDSITRSLASEWGDFNIRVNGIAPGIQ
jgi:peroxisomal 2,4-dienoyl-CoA reductase